MVHKWALVGTLIAAITVHAASGAALAQDGDHHEDAVNSSVIDESCTCSGPVADPIQSAINANSGGGPALAEEIRALVTSQPELAQDAICASRNDAFERPVETAVAQGVAHAQIILTRRGEHDGASLFNWVGCADPSFRSAYVSHQASVRITGLLKPGFVGGGKFGAGVVSPSRP